MKEQLIKKEIIDLKNKTIFVTGASGFIGFYLIKRLLEENIKSTIIGIDNMNDYYDTNLKKWRLEKLYHLAESSSCKWIFIKASIADKRKVEESFNIYQPNIVVNLAAQSGVRYSIENPDVYIESNILGFYNILEACRHSTVEHLVYASSSSVYGENRNVPFSIEERADHPVSLYAATKKTNELLAYSYSKLYNIPTTGLRLFTVYGPAGRPDMAYFSFADKLYKGEKIDIFNSGNCKRDFTYIDDIVEGIIRIIQGAPFKATGEDGLPIAPYSIYNIGSGQPQNLMDFVHILSEELIRVRVLDKHFDIEKHVKFIPMQPGDVPITYADSSDLEYDYGFKPEIDLRTGLRHFAEWYKNYCLV